MFVGPDGRGNRRSSARWTGVDTQRLPRRDPVGSRSCRAFGFLDMGCHSSRTRDVPAGASAVRSRHHEPAVRQVAHGFGESSTASASWRPHEQPVFGLCLARQSLARSRWPTCRDHSEEFLQRVVLQVLPASPARRLFATGHPCIRVPRHGISRRCRASGEHRLQDCSVASAITGANLRELRFRPR